MNNNQGIIIDPTKSNKMIQSPQVSAPVKCIAVCH